jgi:hypothetical protein
MAGCAREKWFHSPGIVSVIHLTIGARGKQKTLTDQGEELEVKGGQ